MVSEYILGFFCYAFLCCVLNVVIGLIFGLCIKIKCKMPKKYENKVRPIYKINILNYMEDFCSITKYDFEQRDNEYFYILFFIIPVPIRVLCYQYTEVHSKNIVSIYKYKTNVVFVKNKYEDFVKICEDDYKSKNIVKIQEGIKELHKNLFEEQVNKVFNENYFG